MKELLATVTSKGQVTIPSELRRHLHIAPHDKVAFRIEDGRVLFGRAGSVTERTAGAVRARSATARRLRRAAEDAVAADVVARARG